MIGPLGLMTILNGVVWAGVGDCVPMMTGGTVLPWGHWGTLQHSGSWGSGTIRHWEPASYWGHLYGEKGQGRFIIFRKQNNANKFWMCKRWNGNNTNLVALLHYLAEYIFFSDSPVITFGCMCSVLFFHYHRHISGRNQHTMPVLECRSFHYIRIHLLVNKFLMKT